jgi:hypothetical protein
MHATRVKGSTVPGHIQTRQYADVRSNGCVALRILELYSSYFMSNELHLAVILSLADLIICEETRCGQRLSESSG